MNELDLHYPPDACPFCNIASAFPASSPSASSPSASTSWEKLRASVPDDNVANPEKTSPSCFIVLASDEVIAFLDILPMTRAHLLVATRGHRVKVEDMRGEEGREMGFWLPILAKVVSKVSRSTDYNIVQNNGARAAQVVPHVHFHIIPRPETMPQIKSKSWTMFGRGQRDELDDDEGASLAAEMRAALREQLEKLKNDSKL
ncbi:HIT-like protein [Sporormia fimetaria CBS 119925]|uniref:HIT-like protein n=1 Tax=Sporormia fimetaria CBS 119925 TaxID=1340428 RepID=A0A6A6UXY5_9PLEO|nr:HIT-like protein [Sporormia fimetaria CBS 119925]